MRAADSLIRLWSLLPGAAWRPGGLELTERALNLGVFAAGARLLDVGCGPGATIRFLRECYGMEAWGLDPRAGFPADGREQFRIRGTAEALPLRSGILDGLFCECVLSLVQDLEGVLRECRRVLAPEGRLVVTDLYHRKPGGVRPGGRSVEPSCLGGALVQKEWLDRVKAAGLVPLVWEDHSHLLVEATVRLVWELGSRQALIDHLVPGGCSAGPGKNPFGGRPGYFLLLARNPGRIGLWTI